ncbi:MAG TPA: DUF1232 domain-containing protein [Actinomycetota bacterium]|nr:DUF1232 domain-containing protein [Actinomycetota bacterium]
MKSLVLALVVAGGAWLALVAALFLAGKRTAAREVATLLPNLIRLFRGLLTDPRVPWSSKVLLVLAVAWFASPIDLVPEFIPVAGPLDDALVAVLVLRRVLRTAGREALAEHWRGSPETLDRLIRLAGVSRARPGA